MRRWIGFSEDDGEIADRARLGGEAATVCQRVEDNAFHPSIYSDITRRRLNSFQGMKIYRGFPERLHHSVPHWVHLGALFHIRIALDREREQRPLTDPALAQAILDSARFYEGRLRWHITLFLLMPDHLHAMLSFARDESMSEVMRDWKRYHARGNYVMWQEGYFDHRLRADERGMQLAAKMNYFRQNPVAAGLCAKAEDWPWIIYPFAQR